MDIKVILSPWHGISRTHMHALPHLPASQPATAPAQPPGLNERLRLPHFFPSSPQVCFWPSPHSFSQDKSELSALLASQEQDPGWPGRMLPSGSAEVAAEATET